MHDWQVNQKVHLYYASEQGLCPKNKNHPIFGWMIIVEIYRKIFLKKFLSKLFPFLKKYVMIKYNLNGESYGG